MAYQWKPSRLRDKWERHQARLQGLHEGNMARQSQLAGQLESDADENRREAAMVNERTWNRREAAKNYLVGSMQSVGDTAQQAYERVQQRRAEHKRNFLGMKGMSDTQGAIMLGGILGGAGLGVAMAPAAATMMGTGMAAAAPANLAAFGAALPGVTAAASAAPIMGGLTGAAIGGSLASGFGGNPNGFQQAITNFQGYQNYLSPPSGYMNYFNNPQGYSQPRRFSATPYGY